MPVGKAAFAPYPPGVTSGKRRIRHRYRRRRLAALLAAAACGLYLAAHAGAEPETEYYVVRPGDTLWSIAAERYPPHTDPRIVVEKIREENGLRGYGIRPGEPLRLPEG
ncbi:hypothetical protein RxyAA322_01380 [Rubrobacter xylanophilus]|uniref:LysM domain-containing protein n=1 Tax=Rubrobacter xylanophilus TaxID=49319 RepID=A0A510HED2_9ACTN|nr:LysM peptidoglycan-binding domain-containing protein [Rubrobacter xylanophilus]BBL78284.1 hypothetical protein RxyAA322_01380 [Rubrobacter xylanophilus]